ncbi:MAG: putative porin [Bacteroidales bacterium]|nr:putative porin [Bacteroidales bacterium]
MKQFHFHIVIFLICLCAPVTAQVVDTSKNINAWKLMHNYSRFEDVELDTSLFDLYTIYNPLYRNGFAYEYLGNLGSAAQNMEIFQRPESNAFLFGTGMAPYMATPDRTIFYNTRNPLTEIMYSNIIGVNWNEETVKFLHTQNMDPFSNIGIEFEVLAGNELYENEESRVTKFTLFGNRTKEKYAAFGTFHFNRFNNEENGGLANPGALLRDSLPENWRYPVNLNNARASYTNLKIFYTQNFKITEKVYHTDSTGITTDSGRNFSFNHQFMAERNNRFYKDQFDVTQVPGLYDNFYYYNGNVKDSVVHDRIINTFQFILGDPYTDPLSARIYAGHELARYGQRSPVYEQVFDRLDTISNEPLQLDSVFKDTATAAFSDHYFNEVFVGFHLAGPPEKLWYWNIDGKYYLLGYYRNNFKANATFARTIFETYRLGIRGNIENRNVSYYHNNYSSAFFQWSNDFKASQLIRADAFVQNPEKNINIQVSTGIWTNYLYWNKNALPAQADKVIYIFSAKIFKHFKIAGFNSNNHLLFQYTTGDDVLHLPLAAIRSSNYWEQDLFKGALKAQIGINVFITTPYKANAYMPATGIFYLQEDAIAGGYPFTDVFLGIRIKRTRIFTSFNNSLAGLISNNYFTAAGYATKPAYFRFGLAWTFYN